MLEHAPDELLEVSQHLVERQLAFFGEDAVQHVLVEQVETEESIFRKLALRQAHKLFGQVESRVVDVVQSLFANVFVEMRRAAAKIQQANLPRSRSDYVEHYAVACLYVFGLGPIDAEMRVAVAIEAVLVMRNDAEILFLRHQANSPC